MFAGWVLGIVLPFVVFRIAARCANCTDLVGVKYARFFIWLQETCGLTLIRSRLAVANKDAQTFIGSYSRWFYWVMCLDEYRMRAYRNAIRALATESQGAVWLDVGTGAHMPLTRLLLQQPPNVVAHVHAVEANQLAFASAKALQRKLGVQHRVTLHQCYSADLVASTVQPQPTAVIHEIIGTTASSEGVVFALRDVFRRWPGGTRMLPHRFATLCVPVSQPTIGIASAVASCFFGGTWRIATTAGIQCLYNPPRATWMAAPGLVEEYGLQEMKAPSARSGRTLLLAITRSGTCTGLFFAPLIHCSPDGATINGLLQKTNWGVEYLCFGDQSMYVEAGDQLKVNFTAQVDQDCPTYSVTVSHTSRVGHSIVLAWRGPQDNMLI